MHFPFGMFPVSFAVAFWPETHLSGIRSLWNEIEVSWDADAAQRGVGVGRRRYELMADVLTQDQFIWLFWIRSSSSHHGPYLPVAVIQWVLMHLCLLNSPIPCFCWFLVSFFLYPFLVQIILKQTLGMCESESTWSWEHPQTSMFWNVTDNRREANTAILLYLWRLTPKSFENCKLGRLLDKDSVRQSSLFTIIHVQRSSSCFLGHQRLSLLWLVGCTFTSM